MHTTIYYVVEGESFGDAQSTLKNRLYEDSTEDNWFTVIGAIRERDLELKILNRCAYEDKDFTISNIVSKINEHVYEDEDLIDASQLYDGSVNEGIWDKQSLTNECIYNDEDRYLFIINMHT